MNLFAKYKIQDFPPVFSFAQFQITIYILQANLFEIYKYRQAEARA